MSRQASVQSETDVGDRLLCLLKSDVTIHNPLRLLGRDSERVINVHRDVMQASSGFFRKLLENDENLEDKLIKFPVSANVLDIVIEFLYTKNALSVDTGRLVELLVLTDLLELDSLKSQLTALLDSHMIDYLDAQDFLIDQPVAVVEEFVRLTSAPTREHHRLRLIRAVHSWAKQNSVKASRIGKLVGDLLDKVPPLEPSTTVASTVRPSKTTPLLFTATGFFELIGEQLTRLQDSFNFSDLYDNIRVWAKQNFVKAFRIGKLVGDLSDKVPPSEPSTTVASTVRPSKTTPLFFTATGFFELIGEQLTRLQDSFNFSDLSDDPECIVIKGNEVYYSQFNYDDDADHHDDDALLVLKVYDLHSGAILRRFHFPNLASAAEVLYTYSLEDISAKLSIKSGRVYASVCNRVYVLAEEGLCLLCRTTMQIYRLSIIEHDTKTLQFYYTTAKDHVRLVTCNRQNNETSEKPISLRGVHIAGLDKGQQVIWTARNQLVLMLPSGEYRFPIGSQPFSREPTSIVCDGCKLYMKFADSILIVDVLTGMKVTHPTESEGRIIIWEKD